MCRQRQVLNPVSRLLCVFQNMIHSMTGQQLLSLYANQAGLELRSAGFGVSAVDVQQTA